MTGVFFRSCCIFTILFHSISASAAFTFNFKPINNWDGNQSKKDIFAACGVGNLPVGVGSKGDRMCDDDQGGPSSFKEVYVHDGYIRNDVLYIQERDKDAGIWHQVLIDESENFKMDIYIRMSMGTAGLGQGKDMSGGKNAGHVYPIDPKNQDITGTGTGDPRRVQFRMLIEEQDFSMDMLKDSWDRKPVITQHVSGPDMNMDLVIDMSNSSYSDMNTPGIVTHTTDITGAPSFSFDSRTSDSSYVTAGRFKVSSSSDSPTYTYVDAPRNFGTNMNWLEFWHGSQFWDPGDRYGYGNGDGDSGKDEDKNWKE